MYGSIPGHQLLVGNSNIPEETPRLFNKKFNKKLRRMNLSQAELCPGNSAPYFRNVLVPARQVPTAINFLGTELLQSVGGNRDHGRNRSIVEPYDLFPWFSCLEQSGFQT